MKKLMLAAAVIACAAPAFAQDKTTLDYAVANGTVIKADYQGMPLEMAVTYKADGTYAVNVMGNDMAGKWRVDGDKLCTSNDMNPNETCIPYPAGKKPGDSFKVNNPMLGEVTVTVNK